MSKSSKNKEHNYLYVVLVATAVIMFWRGVWGLLDLWLFPGNLVLSHIASVFIGLAVLFITHKIKEELM